MSEYPWTPADRWTNIHLRDHLTDADWEIALLAPRMAEAILAHRQVCDLFVGNAHRVCEDPICAIAAEIRSIK